MRVLSVETSRIRWSGLLLLAAITAGPACAPRLSPLQHGGYWIIQVKSREEALEWASRIPGSDSEMVEVRRMFEITDFPADVQKKLEELEREIAAGG